MSTFNELIDFTRSTTGTYLDSVVYGDELVTNGTFDNNIDGWTAYNAVISYDNGKIKVDDSANAGGDSQAYQDITTVAGKTYKLTFDKISTTSVFWFAVGASPAYESIYYSGSLGTQTGQQVLFFKATSALTRIALISSSTGITVYDNCSVKELTGGQVSGTPLLRTAAINEPRLEYDASGNPLGLLIEEARTNAKQYSEVFTTGWSISATTVTSNSTDTTAPDSTNNATKLQVSSFIHETRCRSTASFAQNVDYAFSVFAKAGTSSWLKLRNIGVGDGSSETDTVWFNLSTGSVGTATSNLTPKIESVGNGWYRCSISGTVINTALSLIDVSVVSGNGFVINNTVGDNIYIYGAQLETGAFPTSYIPTTGSTVTRAKDIASLPVEKFAYNQDQGSIVCHFNYFFESGNSKRTYEFSDALSANVIRMLDHNNVNQLQANVKFGGAGVAGILINAPTMLSGVKTFQSYKLNGYSGGADGTLAGTDSNGALPIGINKLSIGSNRVGGATMNGHITSLQYYPKKLTNDELELLTQPSASPTMNLTFDGQATSTLVEGLHD